MWLCCAVIMWQTTYMYLVRRQTITRTNDDFMRIEPIRTNYIKKFTQENGFENVVCKLVAICISVSYPESFFSCWHKFAWHQTADSTVPTRGVWPNRWWTVPAIPCVNNLPTSWWTHGMEILWVFACLFFVVFCRLWCFVFVLCLFVCIGFVFRDHNRIPS